MDLSQSYQRPLATPPDGPELTEEGGPILFHSAPRILPGEAKIQASPPINSGKSA